MYECLICGKQHTRVCNIGVHVKKHGISTKEYYAQCVLKSNIPFCLNCKCKEAVFYNITDGFGKFCSRDCAKIYRDVNAIHQISNCPVCGKPTPKRNRTYCSYSCAGKVNITKMDRSTNKVSEKGRQALRENAKRLHTNGFENRGGMAKFYQVDGMIIQGQYELYYYLTHRDHLSLRKPKQIKTPFGFYTPDFEVDDYFIEIKSTYTFKTCIRNKQWRKIKWVSENIKQVKLKILKLPDINKYATIMKFHQFLHRA